MAKAADMSVPEFAKQTGRALTGQAAVGNDNFVYQTKLQGTDLQVSKVVWSISCTTIIIVMHCVDHFQISSVCIGNYSKHMSLFVAHKSPYHSIYFFICFHGLKAHHVTCK